MNMDGRETIPELLAKWLRLTEAESEAIQSGSWENLEKIQLAKANLRPLLSAAIKADSRNLSSDRDSSLFQNEFKHLIELEMSNRELLGEKLKAAAETRHSLNRSAQNLRRISHSYSRKPDAAWHSYS